MCISTLGAACCLERLQSHRIVLRSRIAAAAAALHSPTPHQRDFANPQARRLTRLSCPSQLVDSLKSWPCRFTARAAVPRKTGQKSSRHRFCLWRPGDRPSSAAAGLCASSGVAPKARRRHWCNVPVVVPLLPSPDPSGRSTLLVSRDKCAAPSQVARTQPPASRVEQPHDLPPSSAPTPVGIPTYVTSIYGYGRKRLPFHIRDRGLGVHPQQPRTRLHSRPWPRPPISNPSIAVPRLCQPDARARHI